MTKRVLLINPRMCSRRSMRLPLSLLALGAALEGRREYEILDGNADADAAERALRAVAADEVELVGVTVMPGPQVRPAIEISAAIRALRPEVPIVWGGYFPTLYPDAALHAPYVDYVARGQGEDTLVELLERLPDRRAVAEVSGLSWKDGGQVRHNPDRHFRPPDVYPPYPYERLADVGQYLRPSFMGRRTAVHQAAIGCRYHCEFCGVVTMWNGATRLQGPARLDAVVRTLRDRWGADALQFYDHNFFDREETSVPVLEVLARHALPWWCYARTDTLANFAPRTWELIRRSRLAMAYVGAEAASDAALQQMKKGARVEHTFAAVRLCRENGVIPELSFVLGGPEDPEGETETTLAFIKTLKAIHPACEVVLYFYTPTPRRESASERTRELGLRLPVQERYGPDGPELPTTPEEWTEPRWIEWVCHRDAPWLSPRLRRRVQDFATVLGCRFPTAQDHTTPRWGKALLGALASWRYASGHYRNPWELRLARRLIPLREPQSEGL
jgi:anaerobic magnesium-protoporphyrin IX monomethyl ester cyclase